MTPPASDEDTWWTKPKEYFNAASLYRELLCAYKSHRCHQYTEYTTHGWDASTDHGSPFDTEYDDFHLSDRGEGFCFHEHTVRLLRALYRHAHRETRERTLLAAGSRLPVELTDLILEHAYQAEGLGPESDICYDPPKEGDQCQPLRLREGFSACYGYDTLPSLPGQRSFNTILFADPL